MTDAEKKEYFKGKTQAQLQQMARRHGYGENSNVYAKYATQGVTEVSDAVKVDYKKRATQQVKDLTPHAKKGEYKDIAQNMISRRQKGIDRVTARGVAEGYNNSKTIIAEALIIHKLWSTAGSKLMEAQLTNDQINQIFQQVEQGATATGGNRTLIGKGKDAAGAVSTAWTDLKGKIYKSKPMTNFASAYDTAAEKLKQATGGDAGTMKYVQKYRDVATKHPMLQSAIYAALIAASGISGVGIGGAAALGLFKLVDQALQGKDIRSAAWSGLKTGGQAFAAGQIGQAMNGTPQGAGDYGTYPDGTPKMPGDDVSVQSAHGDNSMVRTPADGEDSSMGKWDPKGPTDTVGSDRYKAAADITGDMGYDQAFNTFIQKFAQDPKNPSAMIIQQAKQFAATKAKVNESIDLTESQIFLLIGKIVERQRKLDEGIMDTLKGAAGKAVDWAQTKGTNLTTKVTADKLLQAWKKAGSPTDSLDVASIIQKSGVPADTIKQVYSGMKIPFAGQPGGGAAGQRNIPAQTAPVTRARAFGNMASPMTNTPVSKTNTAKPGDPNDVPAAVAPQPPAQIRQQKQATGASVFGNMVSQLSRNKPNTMANTPVSKTNTAKPSVAEGKIDQAWNAAKKTVSVGFK